MFLHCCRRWFASRDPLHCSWHLDCQAGSHRSKWWCSADMWHYGGMADQHNSPPVHSLCQHTQSHTDSWVFHWHSNCSCRGMNKTKSRKYEDTGKDFLPQYQQQIAWSSFRYYSTQNRLILRCFSKQISWHGTEKPQHKHTIQMNTPLSRITAATM